MEDVSPYHLLCHSKATRLESLCQSKSVYLRKHHLMLLHANLQLSVYGILFFLVFFYKKIYCRNIQLNIKFPCPFHVGDFLL
jgi:hypothetical protein